MLFNSLQFVGFFLVVYLVYWRLSHKPQNIFLLIASYCFYAAWDWRFLALIWFSSAVDYILGLRIHTAPSARRKKLYLCLSILVNLSLLGFFKYFNFFYENLTILLEVIGLQPNPIFLKIALPLGISFYTFQTMSYTFDVYLERVKPIKNLPDYFLFVAFFPQMVAGPIERAKHLIPQIIKPRNFNLNWFKEGLFLILLGYFQKIYIADNLAIFADKVFDPQSTLTGFSVWIGAYAFTVQIYCDFAGYSNIARGLARTLGFDIMLNFNFPFFATNIQEFWNRWHISLTTWVGDYLYKPLFIFFSFLGTHLRFILMIMVTMLLLGLWHGARWNAVLFGVYHAIVMIAYHYAKPTLQRVFPKGGLTQKGAALFQMLCMFHIITLGFMIFRAESVAHAGQLFHAMWSQNFWGFDVERHFVVAFFQYLPILLGLEIIQYRKRDVLSILDLHALPKALIVVTLFYCIVLLGFTGQQEFFYFQF